MTLTSREMMTNHTISLTKIANSSIRPLLAFRFQSCTSSTALQYNTVTKTAPTTSSTNSNAIFAIRDFPVPPHQNVPGY